LHRETVGSIAELESESQNESLLKAVRRVRVRRLMFREFRERVLKFIVVVPKEREAFCRERCAVQGSRRQRG